MSSESSKTLIGILAIQGDFDAHARALAEAGAETALVRTIKELEKVDGLVLPGGESTTFLKLLKQGGLWDRLKQFAAVKPTLATCAGCILMATEVVHPSQQSLGVLDITVERNAYGRQIDSTILTSQTRLAGGPLEMVFIRAPRILRTGQNVEVLAERDGHPVLIRQGKCIAATFHPELSADRRIHRMFVELADKSRTRAA